jgi:hypothetical protein
MKLAVIQPYLFPYLGYFQLIHAADVFVVYDDVNYIKGGWINRNNILSQGHSQRVTLAVSGASPNKQINQVGVGGNGKRLLRSIYYSYTKAPQFKAVFPLLENVLQQEETNLAVYLEKGLRLICDYLGMYPEWFVSSSIKKNRNLRGQEKVLDICERLGATHYINLSGGKELYDREAFNEKGIRLSFIESKALRYPQFRDEYVPNLSIIDVMMFNSKDQCKCLLEEYTLD